MAPTGPKRKDEVPFLTSTFKIWLVGFIFFLVFLHVFNVLFLPQGSIIPEKVILGLVLGLMAYLWSQEVRDRHRLEIVNNDLAHIKKGHKGIETDAVMALAQIQESQNPQLHRHAQRVLVMCQAMADAMDFGWEQREILRRACILHDLGRLLLPVDIQTGPSVSMADEDAALIRKHPRQTVDLLAPLRFLTRERIVILHHHEQFDGKGYPSGLKGDQIPLEARMIAVADAFDELNRARADRLDGYSEDFILEEFRGFGGTRLDPRLVVTFLEVLRKNPKFWKIET